MARKKKLLDGSVEQQLGQIDNILTKLIRRSSGKLTVVHIPPIPVMSSNFDRDSGIIISSVIPAKGVITDIALYIEFADGIKKTSFKADIRTKRITNSMEFAVSNALTMDTINIPVEPGNLFVVSANNPSDVKDVSVSVLYQIDSSKGDIQRQLIDELEGPVS